MKPIGKGGGVGGPHVGGGEKPAKSPETTQRAPVPIIARPQVQRPQLPQVPLNTKLQAGARKETAQGRDLATVASDNGLSVEQLLEANPEFAALFDAVKARHPNQDLRRFGLLDPQQEFRIPNAFETEAQRGTQKTEAAERKDGFTPQAVDAARLEEIMARLPPEQAGVLLHTASHECEEPRVSYGGGKNQVRGDEVFPEAAAFVKFCYARAGLELRAPAVIASIKGSIRDFLPPEQLRPGMVTTFKDKSHIEIVTAPQVGSNGVLQGFTTVGVNLTRAEGGRGVSKKFRSLDALEGGGLPEFRPTAKAP